MEESTIKPPQEAAVAPSVGEQQAVSPGPTATRARGRTSERPKVPNEKKSATVELSLHPNAKDAFDKQALELLSRVVTRPRTAPPAPRIFVPDFHIQHEFRPEDIHNLMESERDIDDLNTALFVPRGDQKVGLEEEGCRNLRLLAEKIQGREELRAHLSVKTLEEQVFQWLVDRHLGHHARPLFDNLLPKLENLIKEHSVWVPVFGLFTAHTFDLGRTTVHPLGREFFDTWNQVLAEQPGPDSEALHGTVEHFRRKLQGHAACTMTLQAEPQRAFEIALEEAENTLAILRVFLPSSLHPGVPSYCRPFGREGAESHLVFMTHGNLPPLWFEGVSSDIRPWTLSQEMFSGMCEAGLGVLNKLYLSEKKTEFQKALLRSVLTYSRSSLRKEPADRLIYVFTALDSFLLQNQNESIQQNIAERIAFIISADSQERMEIVRTVIAAYGMRSSAVHHNQSLKDRDTLITFLRMVFRFYVLLILQNDKYKTKQEFFNEVQRLKFS